MSEEGFYRALADHLSAPYYTGEPVFRAGTNPQAAIASGFAALAPDESGVRAVVAPSQNALRLLLEAHAAGRPLPPVAICSRQRLSALIRARLGERIADEAAFALRDSDASLTANSGLSGSQIAAAFAVATVAGGTVVGRAGVVARAHFRRSLADVHRLDLPALGRRRRRRHTGAGRTAG